MSTANKPIDKQAVKDAAVELINKNGKTSNLEVKEDLRAKGYWAKQEDVRELMKALAGEENWERHYNGSFNEYSIKTASNDATDSSTTTTTPAQNTTPVNTGSTLDTVIDSISESLGIYKSAINPNSTLRGDLGFSDSDFDKVAQSIANKVSTATTIDGNEINGCKTVNDLAAIVEQFKTK